MQLEDDFLDAAQLGLAGVEDFDLPALELGVLHVHPHQVGRPQVGLLAALGAADLQDDVALGVGIGRPQELLQAGDHRVDAAARAPRSPRGPAPACRRRRRRRACSSRLVSTWLDQRPIAVVVLDDRRQLDLLATDVGRAAAHLRKWPGPRARSTARPARSRASSRRFSAAVTQSRHCASRRMPTSSLAGTRR